MRRPQVARLQEALERLLLAGAIPDDGGGTAGRENLLTRLRAEHEESKFGPVTREVVARFQRSMHLDASGEVDEATARRLTERLEERALGGSTTSRRITADDAGGVGPGRFAVAGTSRLLAGALVFESGRTAAGQRLRLYSRAFGGTAKLLDEKMAAGDGQYEFEVPAGITALEIRAVDTAGNEVPLTGTVDDLGKAPNAWLELVAPSSLDPVKSEFARLAAAIRAEIDDLGGLAKAREAGGRRDITLLNRATGWDARLIALAAQAVKASAATKDKIPAEAFYGMFRAGLPTAPETLANVSAATVARALNRSRRAGVIGLAPKRVKQIARAFDEYAAAARLGQGVPGSSYSYREILKGSGASAHGQAKFADVFFSHRGDGEQLWEGARAAGISAKDIRALQRHGKLSYLTAGSAPLTERLSKQLKIEGPAQLVEHDLFTADAWKQQILATGDAAAAIPPAYMGDTQDQRLQAYAGDLARKVRVSFPTQVVARKLETDTNDQFAMGNAREATAKLLKSAAAKGFRLGESPVTTFLRDTPGLANGIGADEYETASKQLQALHRVYQITPDDDAMPVLFNLGLTSAHDVAAIAEDDFVAVYGKNFKNVEVAKNIHRKATQVNAVTYNLFTIAKKLESDVTVTTMAPPVAVTESLRDELIKQFPTMESLFGSLDYCECEHCRSVLSPAAYLVDLLQFVDPDERVWNNFLERWRTEHNGQQYPHRENAQSLRPYDVLIKRRPDIAYLQLSCENTHTAMPYIDLVNEILEFYVAHGVLDQTAARDNQGATTEDLVAEPQHIEAGAYGELRTAKYPLALPFDLWTETVRQFCEHFEMPLHELMETFRASDDLLAPGQPFDRSHQFMESLGLTAAEAAIFIDDDPLPGWFRLYGFASATTATTEATDADTGQRIDLNSAKALSRRLGVTYKELTELVKSEFVNPKIASLSVLYKLGVSVQDVKYYEQNKGSYDTNKDLIGKQRAQLSAADQQRYDALTTADWQRLTDMDSFVQRLTDLTAAYAGSGFNAKAWLDGQLQTNSFNRVLVLADLETGCDFDKTIFRYASGTAADPIAFLRLNLFVRLWRGLGWSIEETDRALRAFVPKNVQFETANLSKRPLRSALIYIAHLKALERKLKLSKQARTNLMTLWSPLPTTGKNPLYAQLLLTRSVLKSDPVFDDALGNYLTPAGIDARAQTHVFTAIAHDVAPANKLNSADFTAKPRVSVEYDATLKVQRLSYTGVLTNAQRTQIAALSNSLVLAPLLDDAQKQGEEYSTIKGHMLALQGALGLTAEEIDQILADNNKLAATQPLSVDAVSLLYRYGVLAKALKMPVRELIALKAMSGLAPFKQLRNQELTDIADDYPFSQTLRFVEVAEEVKKSGLSVTDLRYILRHDFDAAGPLASDTEAMLALVRTMAAGVRAIEAEHHIPDDPGAIDDETLRRKLGLALPSDVVDRVIAMFMGTAEFTARKSGVNQAQSLDAEAFTGEPSIVSVAYDPTRNMQTLTFRGVLLTAQKNNLKGRLPRPPQGQPFAPSQVFSDLLDDVQQQAQDFFDRHLKRQPANATPGGGFLAAPDFRFVFGPMPANLTDEQRQERVRQQRERLATAFFPYLAERLTRQFVVETLVAQTGADAKLAETLVTDADVLGDPDAVAEAVQGVAVRGLTATFFDNGGTTLGTATFAEADSELTDDTGTPLAPAGKRGAKFEAVVTVPQTGPYRFFVQLDRQAAEADVSFAHLPEPLLTAVAANANTEASEFLELKAGVPYRLTLDLRKLGTGGARLLVQGEDLPKGPLARLDLMPGAAVDRALRALTRLGKATKLSGALGLNDREVTYLLEHAAAFDNASFSKLPAAAANDTLAGANALFKGFLRLAAHARLKRELAGGTDQLIDVFKANAVDVDDAYEALATVTRREKAQVAMAAASLWANPVLANEQQVERVWKVLQLTERFGAPPATLKSGAGVGGPAATHAQRFAIARDLRESVKSRFDESTWRRVAQPIFDRLRRRQRDALVAYTMNKLRFERVEQLFEHFLIDPGMEPVVQTSRIRLAISSLQLFIQRCLLSLEKQVHPSTIKSQQWQWMKRYRVWEANRKIFLYPENWLEPEFRDDKTHLFKELEGTLLQSDVSTDIVEDAFFNYISKLDELARLDIVAMHIEDKADPAQNTLHVIGRTHGEPHKYFYRRYAQQMWTPWEPVTVEIQGDHLAPVIWRNRLYLFWVTFLAEPEQPTSTESSKKLVDYNLSNLTSLRQKTTVTAQLNWAEYLGREWTEPQMAAGSSPVVRKNVEDWDPRDVFITVSKEPDENGEERGVYIHLDEPISRAFYLAGRNSAPHSTSYSTPTHSYSKPQIPFDVQDEVVNRYSDNGNFRSWYRKQVVTVDGVEQHSPLVTQTILAKGGRFTVLPADNEIQLGNPEVSRLVKPIFYQDARNTFFVEPTVTETTVDEWDSWLVRPKDEWEFEREVDIIDMLDEFVIIPEFEKQPPIPRPPEDPDWGKITPPDTPFVVDGGVDWLVNPGTATIFDGELIGPTGRTGVRVLPAEELAGTLTAGGAVVGANATSGLPSGAVLVASDGETLKGAGLLETAGGLNVVGDNGISAGMIKNLSTHESELAGAGMPAREGGAFNL